MSRKKLNRNKLFIRDSEIPRLEFFDRAAGKMVEIELLCGEQRDNDEIKLPTRTPASNPIRLQVPSE